VTVPVTAERIQIAQEFGLQNVPEAATACREAGLPFYAACALLEKESMGANVYGHDIGGALSGYPQQVDESNYRVFYWLVVDKGWTSNGVGPTQITWAGALRTSTGGAARDGGLFRLMEQQGLRPWIPEENMRYGFGLLWQHYLDLGHSWISAGAAYNGKRSYGADLFTKCEEWRERLGIHGPVEP
jgi:hypothetical protein